MGKVGKNTLNEKRILDELLYQEPKPFKFWALILEATGSNSYDTLVDRNDAVVNQNEVIVDISYLNTLTNVS